jgi:hypothetical protein
VIDALARAEPEVVVHQLTALAGFADLRNLEQGLAATDRLRTGGTDHLLEGIRRLTVLAAAVGAKPPRRVPA